MKRARMDRDFYEEAAGVLVDGLNSECDICA